jgi:alanyl-tRNA synthetase
LVDLTKFVDSVSPTVCVDLQDSYLWSLDVNVLKIVQEKSSVCLALDRTIFHPKSGGQPPDSGTIEGPSFRVNVKRAMLQSGIIIHFGRSKEIR